MRKKLMLKMRARKWISLLVAIIFTAVLAGCAAGPYDRVYYTFDMLVDKSLDHVTHVRYRYGELGESEKPIAKSNGVSIVNMGREMTIPEDFEINWETPDGKQHHKTVPVRSRIKSSVKHKSILFLLLYDDVQGYISTSTSMGEVRERFY